MEDGWLAMFNPVLWLNFVVWQAVKPGYMRFFSPPGSEKVLVPRAWGKGCPRAQICRGCQMVAFSYAKAQLN
jgi:hypothetical protein